MHCPNQLTLISPAGREVFEAGWEGEGLRFEIDEVNRCLSEGLTENPRMPAGETLLLQEILDEIRSQLDVVYPGEQFDGQRGRRREPEFFRPRFLLFGPSPSASGQGVDDSIR